jgi:hypothetical protein
MRATIYNATVACHSEPAAAGEESAFLCGDFFVD